MSFTGTFYPRLIAVALDRQPSKKVQRICPQGNQRDDVDAGWRQSRQSGVLRRLIPHVAICTLQAPPCDFAP